MWRRRAGRGWYRLLLLLGRAGTEGGRRPAWLGGGRRRRHRRWAFWAGVPRSGLDSRFFSFFFSFRGRTDGVAYELALGGSFGVGGTGIEGNASYQHGGRQWRNALWETDGCQRSVSRGRAMQHLERSLGSLREGALTRCSSTLAAIVHPIEASLVRSRGFRRWAGRKSRLVVEGELGVVRSEVRRSASMRLFPGTGIQSRPSSRAVFGAAVRAANRSSHSAEQMPHSLLCSPVNFFLPAANATK